MAKIGLGLDYKNLCNEVASEVNRILSLWNNRRNNMKCSKYFSDDLFLKLAAKHYGLSGPDDFLQNSIKFHKSTRNNKLIYEYFPTNTVNCNSISGNSVSGSPVSSNTVRSVRGDKYGVRGDNDIWLGYNKYLSFLNISLNSNHFTNSTMDTTVENTVDSTDSVENVGEDYTIFVYPYMRKTSRIIVDTLSTVPNLLSYSDLSSLIYVCGSTGSSRVLSFLSNLLNNSINTVHQQYNINNTLWPWISNTDSTDTASGVCDSHSDIADAVGVSSKLNMMLDIMHTSMIINYRMDNEDNLFQIIESLLKNWESTVNSTLNNPADTTGTLDSTNTRSKVDNTLHTLEELDGVILEKIMSILVFKGRIGGLGSNEIRVFSDYVCDRLHRIKPKILSNLALALGYSKSLDEFWMYTLSKHIINLITHSTSRNNSANSCNSVDISHTNDTNTGTFNTVDNVEELDEEDLVMIVDGYSSAGLEDYNFYSVICNSISDKFESFTLENKNTITRSLAKVRHQNHLITSQFVNTLLQHVNNMNNRVNTINRASTVSGVGVMNRGVSSVDVVLDKIVGGMVGGGVISIFDLDYKIENIDPLWKLLSHKVKESYDICSISWLPIVIINFPSLVSLLDFLPVWLRHVSFTINKLRSRTYMMTIQRRHLLLRHALEFGILPKSLLSQKSKKLLDDICNKNYITCKEDYIPESSTFHLEVCACLRALGVTHQREINVVPFVMDIVISPSSIVDVKTSVVTEAERSTDIARCGYMLEDDPEAFPLKYNRNSPNHRKRKQEIYTNFN